MKNLRITSVVVFLLLVVNCTMVHAWNDKVTHPDLTKIATGIKVNDEDEAPLLETYLRDNLGFRDAFEETLPYKSKQKSILDILKEGSKEEDSPIKRSFNHFHEPISNLGLNQLCWPFNPDKYVWKGESALGWARGTGEGCRDAGKCTGNEYS